MYLKQSLHSSHFVVFFFSLLSKSALQLSTVATYTIAFSVYKNGFDNFTDAFSPIHMIIFILPGKFL